MYNEKLETIFINVESKNLPDKDIEIFWYSWKNAIYNTFKKQKTVLDLFKLSEYSEKLNMLQNLEDYICIQQLIQTYIERHLILSIENYIDMYNANILDTHLKRWEKLSKKSNKLSNIVIKNSNFNFKLFSLYLLILNCKLYSINLKKIL